MRCACLRRSTQQAALPPPSGGSPGSGAGVPARWPRKSGQLSGFRQATRLAGVLRTSERTGATSQRGTKDGGSHGQHEVGGIEAGRAQGPDAQEPQAGEGGQGPDAGLSFRRAGDSRHTIALIGRDRGQEAALPGPFRFIRRGLSVLAMTSTRFLILALSMGVTLLMVSDALAGPATDQLRTSVDLVVKILSDPELKKEARSLERRRAIRAVANQIFDFGEISRRSLARHWQPRTPAEHEEFTRLFGDLLEYSYVSKIEVYSGEKVVYVGELLDGDLATVRTRIITKQGTEIPVDYRLARQGDQWRAYDVLIEGVSLVANYRAQFNAVIQRTSYADLVKTLRVRRDEAVSKPSAVAPAAMRPVAPTPVQTQRSLQSP